MELTKIKKLIKFEAERVFPKENYLLQELWIKECVGEVPFFAFSRDETHTILMTGTAELDLTYSMETLPNEEFTTVLDDFILLGYSCFSIRG